MAQFRPMVALMLLVTPMDADSSPKKQLVMAILLILVIGSFASYILWQKYGSAEVTVDDDEKCTQTMCRYEGNSSGSMVLALDGQAECSSGINGLFGQYWNLTNSICSEKEDKTKCEINPVAEGCECLQWEMITCPSSLAIIYPKNTPNGTPVDPSYNYTEHGYSEGCSAVEMRYGVGLDDVQQRTVMVTDTTNIKTGICLQSIEKGE